MFMLLLLFPSNYTGKTLHPKASNDSLPTNGESLDMDKMQWISLHQSA